MIDLGVILYTAFLILLICVVALVRNNLVLRYRLNLIDKDFNLFLTLPDYSVMAGDALIWNFDKYLFSVKPQVEL